MSDNNVRALWSEKSQRSDFSTLALWLALYSAIFHVRSLLFQVIKVSRLSKRTHCRVAEKMERKQFCFLCVLFLGTFLFLLQYATFVRRFDKETEIQVKAFSYDGIGSNDDRKFQIYVRMTSTKNYIDYVERWLLRSMKMFFLKKYLELVLVLDNEKSEDHKYGDKFAESHPEINTKVCYMDPVADNADHGWGKARMYLDMMHADSCSTKEYVGFVDVDTVFVTAFTDDVLFENGKPIVIGRIGVPQFPCWIQTAEYILGDKQVMQCMSYFPVTFKVAHIVEMRKYVEKLHLKSFNEVFKEAPSKVKVGHWCYCHFSIMCNYMWQHHRDEYAWHLQMVPDGKWNGEGAIPSMVDPKYFQIEIKSKEKFQFLEHPCM